MATSFATCAGGSASQGTGSDKTDRGRAVLLINVGSPATTESHSVRRYLREFLGDPHVIQLPARWRWCNGPLAALIARFRAPRSAAAYGKIWTDGGSPLKVITERQVSALAGYLSDPWDVYYAMRYGAPAIDRTIRRIAASGARDLVVIPMYPQYSGPSTGSALARVYRSAARCGLQQHLQVRTSWHEDSGYIDAQAELIHRCAQSNGLGPLDTVLLFSAHSLPQSYVDRGDPYERHVRRTVELVNQRLGWPPDRTRLCFQSKLGPVPWLSPSTPQCLDGLAGSGEKRVLVCPISFTADCLETLEEIGMRYASTFADLGGKLWLCPCLNDFDPFIKALAVIARRGVHPAGESRDRVQPLLRQAEPTASLPASIDSLVMVGVSVPGRLVTGCGPPMRHVEAATLNRIKRPASETVQLLRQIHRDGQFSACWLWNTCNRFEFYGCGGPPDRDDKARRIGQISEAMFPGDELQVNVLRGSEAWHHLLRTAAGLNSTLPGDRQVIEQLESAWRMARCAGTVVPGSWILIDQVRAVVEQVLDQTAWSSFACDYCHAALRDLVGDLQPPLAESRCLLVGGSTTSRSILRLLVEPFGVPRRQVTLVHRRHGTANRLKMWRRAVGQGRRVLVHHYGQPVVLDAIGAADVVFFGIDRSEAPLEGQQIASLRDYRARPLVLIDFNTFGSIDRLPAIDGLRLISASHLEAQVDRYARQLMAAPRMHEAAEAAERAIRAHLAMPRPGRQAQPAQRLAAPRHEHAELAPS